MTTPTLTFLLGSERVTVSIDASGLKTVLEIHEKALDDLDRALVKARDAFDAVAPLKAVTAKDAQAYFDAVRGADSGSRHVRAARQDLADAMQAVIEMRRLLRVPGQPDPDLLAAQIVADLQGDETETCPWASVLPPADTDNPTTGEQPTQENKDGHS